MENMVISLNAVLPLFLIIALGCAAKQLHILSDDAARQANGLCFQLFMAPLLFYNVYSTDLASAYSWKLLVFCVVGTLAEFAFGLLFIPHIEPSRPAQGVMLQAFCRPNIVLLGLPLSTALFGPENIGHIAFMLAVLVPLINILAVLALELFRGGTPNPKRILLGVAKNPFVLGAVAGFLCKLLQIQLPYVLDSVISSMAEAATPLALVLMGTSMNFGKLQGCGRSLTVCTVVRLFAAPVVFLSLAVALGFRGVPLCGVMLVFATPVAVNSYTMALQMDGDADLAGGIVLLTTGLSCLTLFLWIFLLKALGLF